MKKNAKRITWLDSDVLLSPLVQNIGSIEVSPDVEKQQVKRGQLYGNNDDLVGILDTPQCIAGANQPLNSLAHM